MDDCTRFCYVYLLKSKDEAIDAFNQYKNEVENQLNLKIKMIQSDRGGEYESPFAEICLEYGIIHQTTAPYTPQSNGLAKEMINDLMINSGSAKPLGGNHPYS